MQKIIFKKISKSLYKTNEVTLFEGEQYADYLEILLPLTYNNIDLSNCNIELTYILPDNTESSFLINDFKDEDIYKEEYYRYLIDINSYFTQVKGTVIFYITIYGFNNEKDIILKTNETNIKINCHKSGTKQEPTERELNIIEQVLLQSNRATTVVNTMQERMDSGEFKGDPGDDYVITQSDYEEIAQMTYDMVDHDISQDVINAKTEINQTKNLAIDDIVDEATSGVNRIDSAYATAKANMDVVDEHGNVLELGDAIAKYKHDTDEKVDTFTDKLDTKVDIPQGLENVGKILAVDDQGNVGVAIVPPSTGAKYDNDNEIIEFNTYYNYPNNNTLIIDNQMSDSSTNPVKNNVIKSYIDNLVNLLVPKTRTIADLSLSDNISSASLAEKIINIIKNTGDLASNLIPWVQGYTGTKTQQDTNTVDISTLRANLSGVHTAIISHTSDINTIKTDLNTKVKYFSGASDPGVIQDAKYGDLYRNTLTRELWTPDIIADHPSTSTILNIQWKKVITDTTVDSVMSDLSTNPIQNSTVKTYVDNLVDDLASESYVDNAVNGLATETQVNEKARVFYWGQSTEPSTSINSFEGIKDGDFCLWNYMGFTDANYRMYQAKIDNNTIIWNRIATEYELNLTNINVSNIQTDLDTNRQYVFFRNSSTPSRAEQEFEGIKHGDLCYCYSQIKNAFTGIYMCSAISNGLISWKKITTDMQIDSHMSDSSSNPVENSVIKSYVDTQDTATLNTAKAYTDTQVLDTYSVKKVQGSSISIDDATNKPIIDLTVGIEPKQAGSGTPSPTNVRALSGWESVKVKRLGKNLLDLNRTLGEPSSTRTESTYKRTFNYNEFVKGITANNYYIANNVNYVYGNNEITVTPTSSGYGIGLPVKVKSNTTYTFSCNSTNTSTASQRRVIFYKADGTYISNVESGAASNKYVTFTTPNDCEFIVIVLTSASGISTTFTNLQLEVGSTATAYEPYNSQSTEITINLGRTVYGGSLDVTTGLLTVDKGIYTITYANVPTTEGNVDNFNFNLSSMAVSYKYLGLCDKLPTVTTVSTLGILFGVSNSAIYLYGLGTYYEVSTMAELRAKMQNDNITFDIVYQLAEPQTYQLTPTEITTLLGNNTIYADSGNSTLEYRQDATRALAKKVDDVQINGTSTVVDGVANIPVASASANNLGVVKLNSTYGIQTYQQQLMIIGASDDELKAGNIAYRGIFPSTQHKATFYGLAKAAGDTTQASSSNAVGNYTPQAKTKIMNMLGDKYELISTDVLANDTAAFEKAIDNYENVMVAISTETGLASGGTIKGSFQLYGGATVYGTVSGISVSNFKTVTLEFERKASDVILTRLIRNNTNDVSLRSTVTSGGISNVKIELTNATLPSGSTIKIYGKGKV